MISAIEVIAAIAVPSLDQALAQALDQALAQAQLMVDISGHGAGAVSAIQRKAH
jgi:uncharacterized protein YggE